MGLKLMKDPSLTKWKENNIWMNWPESDG